MIDRRTTRSLLGSPCRFDAGRSAVSAMMRRWTTTSSSMPATARAWSGSASTSSTGPTPAALADRRAPDRWADADLRFDRDGGWTARPRRRRATAGRSSSTVSTLELRPTEAGQVGLFPEHAATAAAGCANASPRRRRTDPTRPQPVRLHRAGDARAGAGRRRGRARRRVPAVRRLGAPQRRAATASPTARSAGSSTTPATFAARELRRGRRYDGIVLDPPTYGHGTVGRRRWRLERRPPDPARRRAPRSLAPDGFVLLTAHTEALGPTPGRARDDAVDPRSAGDVEIGELDARARRRRQARARRVRPLRRRVMTATAVLARRSPARRTRGSRRPPGCAIDASARRPA